MKVALNTAQLTQAVPGGIGRYVGALCRYLPEHGVEVIEFGPRRGHALVYEWWHRQRRIPVAAARGADVMHAPSLAVPPPGRRPLVVTVHDLVFLRYPETMTPRGVAFHRRGLAIARNEAAVVIVPSAFVAGELGEAGFAADRIVVAHHGVDTGTAPAPDELHARLERLGVRSPFVLAVGTLEPRKGLDVLVAAMRGVTAEHGVTLVVAGTRGWGDVTLGAADATQWVEAPSDSDLDALYRGAVALAYPSRYEGFGLPVLEAMARGCPVVGTDASAVAEVAGDAATLVPVGDADALAGAIAGVVGDRSLRERQAAAGRDRAATFTWERSAMIHRDTYSRACSEACAAPGTRGRRP